MLRNFPASNAWTAISENAGFSESSLKVTKLSKFWHFFLFKILLSSLMVVPSSSINMEILKGGNVEIDIRVNIYVRKWRILLVLNLTKQLMKIKR